MNQAVKLMLERYSCHSLQEHEQALREILQEIALVGLWRGKFFEHAGFYGGTALRIFYNLDRFSEDLDFTLTTPNPKWSWEPYGEVIRNELSSFGFEVTFMEKEKTAQTAIKSAFLKTPTVQELLKIGVHSDMLKPIHRDTLIRIKIEIDTELYSDNDDGTPGDTQMAPSITSRRQSRWHPHHQLTTISLAPKIIS